MANEELTRIITKCPSCGARVRLDAQRYKDARCRCGALLKQQAANTIVDLFNKAKWAFDSEYVALLGPLFKEITEETFWPGAARG